MSMIGKVIDDFKITGVLGQGGMGAVYKGLQVSLNREVAIKVLDTKLTDSEEFVKRFGVEAQAVGKLNHPNIIQIYSKGVTDDGLHFFAMEYVEGEDLSEKLKKNVKYSTEEIIELIIQSCRGLELAHKNKIIHRDIKPSNLMISSDNVVKITDFGLAKSLEATNYLTKTNVFMGTVHYASPEQGMGEELDQRTDIYSLGIVLYQLLTNKVPFDSSSAPAIIYQHIHEPPIDPREICPTLSLEISNVVLQAIAKTPDDRFKNAAKFREALESVLRGGPGIKDGTVVEGWTEFRKVPQGKGKGKGKGKTKLIMIAAIPLVLAIGAAVWFLRPKPTEEDKKKPVETDIDTDTWQYKYSKIMEKFLTATSFGERNRLEDEAEKLKKAYPVEYEKNKKLIESELLGFSKRVSRYNKLAEGIEFVKDADSLMNFKKEINDFKEEYSKYTDLCSDLSSQWEKKNGRLSLDAFRIVKQKIKDTKNEADAKKYLNDFSDRYPSSEYLDTLSDITDRQIVDIHTLEEAMVKISNALDIKDQDGVRNIRKEYLAKFATDKYKDLLSDYVRKELKKLETAHAEEEDNLFEEAKNNIVNAAKVDDLGKYVSNFKKEYPYSKYLSELEDLENRRTVQLKDTKNLNDAKSKIQTAVAERDVIKIQSIMDEYLNILSSYKNKNALEDFAGENIYTLKRGLKEEEEKTFEIAKNIIENAKTVEEIDKYVLDFNKKYPYSKFSDVLGDMKDRQISQIKDIENLTVAKSKITAASEKNDIQGIELVREEYQKLLTSYKNKIVLDDFAREITFTLSKGQKKQDERVAFETLKNIIDSAERTEDINTLLVSFRKEYPDSSSLVMLEELQDRKLVEFEDIKNLNDAKSKILAAFDERDTDKIQSVKDEYLELLTSFESKNILNDLVRDKTYAIANEQEQEEEKLFKTVKYEMENAETEEEVNSYSLEFTKKYPGGRFAKTIRELQDRKLVEFEDIKNLNDAKSKILAAFDERDTDKIQSVKDEYLKKLKSEENGNILDGFARDKIYVLMESQEKEEGEAFETVRNNMESSNTDDEINKHFLSFKKSYPDSKFLSDLEDLKNRKVAFSMDVKNLNGAMNKITAMFDKRDADGILVILDKELLKLKTEENKETLNAFARDKVKVIKRLLVEEEKEAFVIAEKSIMNSKTRREVGKHFKSFKDRYPDSEYLSKLRDLKPPNVPEQLVLRTQPKTCSFDDVISVMKKYNFYGVRRNPTGNFENNYEPRVINGDQVVIDHETNLMWHQSGSSKKSWAKAKKWVKKLNDGEYAGHKGWRLPTVDEAASLLESKVSVNKLYIDPVFEKKQDRIWTNDTFSNAQSAMIALLDLGDIGQGNKNSSSFVRPVRTFE